MKSNSIFSRGLNFCGAQAPLWGWIKWRLLPACLLGLFFANGHAAEPGDGKGVNIVYMKIQADLVVAEIRSVLKK